jgi:hypothetical protein
MDLIEHILRVEMSDTEILNELTHNLSIIRRNILLIELRFWAWVTKPLVTLWLTIDRTIL